MNRGPKRGRRMMLVAASLAIAAAAVGFACGFDGEGEKPAPDPGADTSVLTEASVIQRSDGSRPPPDDVGVPDGPVMPTCPTTEGPTMVRVADGGAGPGLCIDSTEVTNAQYDKFLAATNNGAADSGVLDGGLPPRCNAIKTFARPGPPTDAGVTTPVTRISWCGAAAYCAWAGKRLCGGGTYEIPDAGEWYGACSAHGMQATAYGTAFVPGTCNENDVGGALEPVGSRAACQGSAPGVFDMNGNAAEWVDVCNGPGDASICIAQGSAFSNMPPMTTCVTYTELFVSDNAPYVGFRCCATPQ